MTPLDRAHVTTASRVMLPAYVVLCAVYGLVYLLDPLDRVRFSHSLTYPRNLAGGSMEPWGWFFLAVAVALAVALRRGSRQGYVFTICVFAATWILWAAMYALSVHTDSQASVLAPVAPLFYATCCVATTRSLLTRET